MSGSGDIIRVVAAVIEHRGKILLAQRNGGRLDGKWEFPGGKIHEDETPQQALEREIAEEFSISVRVGMLIDQVPFEKDGRAYLLIGYWARYASGEFRLTDHRRLAWLAPADLTGMDLLPADVPIAEKVVRILNQRS